MLDSESTIGIGFAIKKYSKKGIRKCTHCNGNNHVMETCFKLHRYPDWHPKSKTTSNTNVEATSKSHISIASGFVT